MNNDSRSLRNSEATVLGYVAKHGPVHGYLIHKLSNLLNKTTYVALKGLVEKGLLIKVAAEKQNRPGQPMQVYHLTLRGLYVGLGLSDILWKRIDLIVEEWKNLLPFIFERWERFNEAGLAEEVKKALKRSVEFYAMDWKLGYKLDDKSERVFVEERFLQYLVNEAQPPEVLGRWNRFVHSDEGLRQKQESLIMRNLVISQALTEQQTKKLPYCS